MWIALIIVAAIALLAWLFIGKQKKHQDSSAGHSEHGATVVDAEELTRATMGGIVLLRDNDWADCRFDGMSADWNSMTQQGVRGFHSVHSGRHQAVVASPSRTVVHDFTLYPGETYIRRLDGNAFELDSPEVEERYRRLAWGGAIGNMSSALVNLFMVRVRADDPPDHDPARIAAAVGALAQLIDECGGEVQEQHIKRAVDIGLGLLGCVMPRSDLHKITGLVDMKASLLAMQGNFRRAAAVAQLGLGVLPGDPFLLDLMANLLADGGLPDEALEIVEQALRRSDALGPEGTAKVQATKAEIETALSARS